MKRVKVYDYNEMKTVLVDFDTLVSSYAVILKKDYSDLNEFFKLHFISKKHRKAFENALKHFEATS